jgi:AbrB family looped-hinge helix DNA binding protein
MITAKITEKGEITLPRRVRQALNVKPGERVQFIVGDESVVLRPVVTSRVAKLAGSLRQYARPGEEASQVRSQVRKEVGRAAAQEG